MYPAVHLPVTGSATVEKTNPVGTDPLLLLVVAWDDFFDLATITPGIDFGSTGTAKAFMARPRADTAGLFLLYRKNSSAWDPLQNMVDKGRRGIVGRKDVDKAWGNSSLDRTSDHTSAVAVL
ncbi:hypothetical protein CLCR_00983 [Cladophialophora carrionii]|uniref:Uncharacterized protein n=1 Tax=Cladophialophora carrionii TaxID=86049 RepID=A0A1C1D101_9EURO|nr:hypothetical protein CLCR_00983 [Cladophialophora carrionii]